MATIRKTPKKENVPKTLKKQTVKAGPKTPKKGSSDKPSITTNKSTIKNTHKTPKKEAVPKTPKKSTVKKATKINKKKTGLGTPKKSREENNPKSPRKTPKKGLEEVVQGLKKEN